MGQRSNDSRNRAAAIDFDFSTRVVGRSGSRHGYTAFTVAGSHNHIRIHERLVGNLHKCSHSTGIDVIVQINRCHPL